MNHDKRGIGIQVCCHILGFELGLSESRVTFLEQMRKKRNSPEQQKDEFASKFWEYERIFCWHNQSPQFQFEFPIKNIKMGNLNEFWNEFDGNVYTNATYLCQWPHHWSWAILSMVSTRLVYRLRAPCFVGVPNCWLIFFSIDFFHSIFIFSIAYTHFYARLWFYKKPFDNS